MNTLDVPTVVVDPYKLQRLVTSVVPQHGSATGKVDLLRSNCRLTVARIARTRPFVGPRAPAAPVKVSVTCAQALGVHRLACIDTRLK